MLKKILIAFSILVLLGAIVLVIFLIKNKQSTILVGDQIENQIQRPAFPQEFLNDKDQDGLTAEQELELGTSDTETDTDGDGLSDFQEVNETKTDPLKLDTDGDGFADYIEILSGNNPNQK